MVITRCRYQRRLLFKVRERLGKEGGARGEEKEEGDGERSRVRRGRGGRGEKGEGKKKRRKGVEG